MLQSALSKVVPIRLQAPCWTFHEQFCSKQAFQLLTIAACQSTCARKWTKADACLLQGCRCLQKHQPTFPLFSNWLMLPECVRIPDSMLVSSEDLMGLPACIQHMTQDQPCLHGLAINTDHYGLSELRVEAEDSRSCPG